MIMMAPLAAGFFFFILDFMVCGIACSWISYTLWYYFFYSYFTAPRPFLLSLLALTVLQDFFLFSRCGLILVVALPALFFTQFLITRCWDMPRMFAAGNVVILITWNTFVSQRLTAGTCETDSTIMLSIVTSIVLVELVMASHFLLAHRLKAR